jgi:hypothetical protein
VTRLQEAVEERTGYTVAEKGRLDLLEAAATEGRALRRELDLIGWSVLDYLSGQPQELRFEERKKMAQQARMVWAQDPQAGAAVDLSNDFVFGRGVPRPKCRDEAVQEVVDEAWADPDNQAVLTSYEAQIALNTDLELQSNLFLLMFDGGEDGKVKLGLLDHDTVENAVRDPQNRLRVLYYVAKTRHFEWDFTHDRPALPGAGGKPLVSKTMYYDHWRNVADAEEEEREEPLPKPPKEKHADGKVRHVAVNRTAEMAFGVPRMRRTIRWFTAYNDLLKARVDMAQAAAAFIMKRKVQGTPTQLAKLAAKAVSRRSDLAESGTLTGPRPASVLSESETVEHEPLSLDSGAANAAQDAQMIRAQVSAATHFPQHYFGGEPGSLAGATAAELPVIKHIEGRQEVWEGVFRWFIDRVIEKAVDDGRLDRYIEGEAAGGQGAEAIGSPNGGAPEWAPDLGAPAGSPYLGEAHEDQADDERSTERDLSYEFSMPNALKRMMADLVGAVTNIARTFDPNNTNVELSRILLAIVLGEGLEVEDPQGLVERIFPEDYVDPAVAAAQAAAQGGGPPGEGEPPTATGADGEQHGAGNPYGAPMNSPYPEEMAQGLSEARFGDLSDVLQVRQRGRVTEVERMFNEEVRSVVDEALAGLLAGASTNGKH